MRFLLAVLAALPLSAAAQPVGYDAGMAARKDGDYDGARAAFEALLAKDPNSGGALEGLSLTSLSDNRPEDAVRWLERWKTQGDSAYIESLLARAYGKLGRENEQIDAFLTQGALDRADLRPLRRADGLLRAGQPGLFPWGALYKSLSQEGLETTRPQQIVYEGRSGGASARFALGRGFSAVAGAVVRQEAQRNDTGGFTYYDILEQIYTTGLEGRWRRARWTATYGQSFMSDNKAAGVGKVEFSRANVSAEVDAGPATLRISGERAPYFLRGAPGSRFFAILREATAKAELEASALGLNWLARGALYDYSENTTLRSANVSAYKEISKGQIRGSYTRSFQEHFGAGNDGRLNAVAFDRGGVSARWTDEERWEASGSAGYASYYDGNHLTDADGSARVWLPFYRDLSARWHATALDYQHPAQGYRSSDQLAHWAGPMWRRRWTLGLQTELGWEHGWLRDPRGAFEGNAAFGEVEYYVGRAFSLAAQGRIGATTIRDESYSAGLQARWSF